MLALNPNPTFTASVVIPVPGGGDQTIALTYKHMGKAALRAYLDAAKTRDDLASVLDIVAGWDGVEAEFSGDTLATLLDSYPMAAVAILEAYVVELGRAATKN